MKIKRKSNLPLNDFRDFKVFINHRPDIEIKELVPLRAELFFDKTGLCGFLFLYILNGETKVTANGVFAEDIAKDFLKMCERKA